MDAFSYFDFLREQAYPTPYANSPLLPLLLLSLTSQKHSPRTKTDFLDEYDYIIVGAGSAGSVVASRLSEVPCVNVLLLEAGKPSPKLTDIPAISRSFIGSDLDWQFTTMPQRYTAAGLIDRRIPWPSGKTLGGSSTINGMLYLRGNRRNYDGWAKLGAKGWSYKEVLPYFKKLENNTDQSFLENGYHASGGPITASRPAYDSEKKIALIKAILNEGHVFVDPNSFEQNGFYDYQLSMKNGQRCSTAKGYLVPAENRTNLDILPNAMVRKILIENKKAMGVEFYFGGFTYEVKARKEVIVSTGTTNTAQLLMLSGIGPMSELKKFNIPVVADLPVGLNLQNQPITFLIYEVDNNLERFDDEMKKEDNIRDYIDNRKGPLTVSEGFELIAFLSNFGNGMENPPDYFLSFSDFDSLQISQSGVTPEVTENVLLPLANKSLIYCVVTPLHTKSIGTVALQSTNPFIPPLIDPNYYADFHDINDVVQGMKTCQRIMNNPAMKQIGAKLANVVIPGCEEFAEDEDMYFRCILRTIVITTSHQVGTAKMGDPTDPSTVVDPQLRVKGIQHLRVADASIMPTVPWATTNIPSIMVGEKASDIIKSTIRCKRDAYYTTF